MVRYLLSLGADPLLKGPYTCDSYICDGHVGTALGSIPVSRTNCQHSEETRWTDSTRDTVWNTMNVLLDTQTDTDECLTLLERSIQTGQARVVKRLLGLDFRLQEVPETWSLETLDILFEHKCAIDVLAMQKRAIVVGEQAILLRLMEIHGDQLKSMDTHTLCETALLHGHFDMFCLLVSRYMLDIDQVGCHPSDMTKLLQIACRLIAKAHRPYGGYERSCRAASIQATIFLLQAGANAMQCGPEQVEDALTMFQKALRSEYMDPEDEVVLWPLVQQLERCMPQSHVNNLREACYAESSQVRASSASDEGFADTEEYFISNSTIVDSGSVADHYLPRASQMPRPDGPDFKHTPLTGPESSAIRTLTLQPSNDMADLIECRVAECDLAELPTYKALSYVWGTKSIQKYIVVNSQVMHVTPNLYDALRRLRHPSEPQVLWIDAVCIDQETRSERNQQVAIMGDVYRHAQTVLIWLGEEAEDSKVYFQYLEDLRKCYSSARADYYSEPEVMRGNKRRRWDPMRPKPTHRPLPERPAFDARVESAFRRLCRRPWFLRTWVIQELALSKNALVCCGPYAVTWNEFHAADRVSSSLKRSKPAGDYKFHPLHGWDILARINDLRSTKLEGNGHLPDYSRPCQVSEPKDRIYGILGLFPPGLIQINYDYTVQGIFTQFAQAIVGRDGHIRMLHDYSARITRADIPSWVPDFGSATLAGTLPRKNPHYVQRLDEGIGNAIIEGSQLFITGKVVDSIKHIGQEMVVNVEYAPGTRFFLSVLTQWEEMASSLAADKFFMGAVSDAFLITMVASDPFTEFGSHHRGPGVAWYRSHGSGLLRTKEPKYFEDVDYYTLSIGKTIDEKLNREYLDRVDQVVYGRRFFVSENGSMGLASPTAQVGDRIVLFPGHDFPFVIRGSEEHMSSERTSTLHGDCYLFGLDVSDVKVWENLPSPVRRFIIR